jgi:hypothetical protein
MNSIKLAVAIPKETVQCNKKVNKGKVLARLQPQPFGKNNLKQSSLPCDRTIKKVNSPSPLLERAQYGGQ